jgi:hypothetical protein
MMVKQEACLKRRSRAPGGGFFRALFLQCRSPCSACPLDEMTAIRSSFLAPMYVSTP